MYDDLKGFDEYYIYLVDTITNLIKDNLLVLYYDENSLKEIKKLCKTKDKSKKIKPIGYWNLVYYTNEVLRDLLEYPEYYDFRDI